METIDLCNTSHDLPSCIDLTREGDEEEVVDLTSLNDTSIEFSHLISPFRQSEIQVKQRNLRALRRQHSCSPFSTSQSTSRSRFSGFGQQDNGDESDSDLPVFDLGISMNVSKKNDDDDSPPRKDITCPVCFDSDKTIQLSQRQLVSTVCGHVFCNICIHNAIRSSHSCPNCRKRLTLKQYHPIFI
ncbi:E3 ubiquitin-protein ligase RNF4-like isoform X2 [Limulus polyphemus]|nr:E3 ubiquitin-protein ligase RNF4-like isoform X2 [Limulus polyphemus]XP_022250221.1 E3 ubiquitin-protein ligase RNF4-like isoform X2 [Limulus polyphemus]